MKHTVTSEVKDRFNGYCLERTDNWAVIFEEDDGDLTWERRCDHAGVDPPLYPHDHGWEKLSEKIQDLIEYGDEGLPACYAVMVQRWSKCGFDCEYIKRGIYMYAEKGEDGSVYIETQENDAIGLSDVDYTSSNPDTEKALKECLLHIGNSLVEQCKHVPDDEG